MKRRLIGGLRANLPLVLTCLVALGLRLAWLIVAEPLPVSDFAQYLDNARDLIEHGSYGYPEPTAYRLPLYPMLLAGQLLIWDSTVWLAFWAVVTSSSICLLVYFVVRRFGDSKRLALLAAIICAVFPQFVLFAPVLASEHLLAVLFLSALLCITNTAWRPTARFGLAGLIVGLGILTRGDGAIYGMVVLAWGVLWLTKHDRWIAYSRRSLQVVVLFGLVILVVISPWVVRNHRVIGPGTLLGGNGGQAFWYGHNSQGYGFIPVAETPLSGLSETDMQHRGWELGLEFVRENPLSLIASAYRGTNELFAPGLQDYGVFWATRDPSRATRDDLVWHFENLAGISRAAAWVLTTVSALALLNVRAVGLRLTALVGSVVAADWFFYAVVFLGNPRYRYIADVMLSMLAAAVLMLTRGTSKHPSRLVTGGPE